MRTCRFEVLEECENMLDSELEELDEEESEELSSDDGSEAEEEEAVAEVEVNGKGESRQRRYAVRGPTVVSPKQENQTQE